MPFVMKTKPSLNFYLLSFVFYLVLALRPAPCALSQVPQGFNYQAIARDGSGNPISTPIDVKIAILSSTDDADVIWEEEHLGVDPDDHGLFSIVVGQGDDLVGSFGEIDWTVSPKYIRTKINNVKLGTAQIWSVPYAMVADSLGGPLSKLKVKAPAGSGLDEALFEVKNKTGQTVFAVYNEGVRIYVDNGSKGAKGGFSVGGFGTDLKAGESQLLLVVNKDSIRAYVWDDPLLKAPKGGFSVGGFNASKGVTNEYLMVSPDCVRVYIDNAASAKGAKGGFSVGGFDAAKGETQKFLSVSIDSVRVYIDDTPGKSAKGGFSVGGFGATKGTSDKFLRVTPDSTRILTGDPEKGFGIGNLATGVTENYLKITPQNYFIGHEAGKSNVYNEVSNTGDKNIFIGFQAGTSNIGGRYNTFLGYQAGKSNTGSDNTFIGYLAGKSHQTKGGNVFIGSKAGESETEGEQNVLIGESVGSNTTTGKQNIMMGVSSGNQNTTGSNNVFLGFNAAMNNTTGNSNVIVGNESGANHSDGEFNTFIGYQSGYNNFHAQKNVFLGYQTGYENDGYNNVFIGYQSGKNNDGGHDNVFMGSEAGFSNYIGDNNVFIGANAGQSNYTGGANIFMGANAGKKNYDGSFNLFFGNQAGNDNQSGDANILMGTSAGFKNQTGNHNVYLGYYAGVNGTDANRNVFLGRSAGYYSQADSNVFIGSWAGYANGTGEDNIYIGSGSGYGSSMGMKNIMLGYKAGYSSSKGNNNIIFGTEAGHENWADNNIFIGYQAGYSSNETFAGNNIFLGYNAGFSNTGGSSNIFIGQNAGNANATGINNTFVGNNAGSGPSFNGSGNVFIGNLAGSAQESSSNLLFIDNTGTATPLIWGNFADDKLAFYAKVGIGTNNPGENLEIGGTDSKIFMNSSGSNILFFNDQGVAAPSFLSRSNGTKLVLKPSLTTSSSDFALGIETNALWYSVPEATSDYSHKFYGGGTELFRIRGDGNIGIGMTNPAYKLHVSGIAKFISHLLVDGNIGIATDAPGQKLEIGGANPQIFMNGVGSNFLRFNDLGVSPPSVLSRSPGTKIVISPNPVPSSADYAFGFNTGVLWYSVPLDNDSYSHKFYGGEKELMTIRGSGNVGIGTITPGQKLEIGGTGSQIFMNSQTSNMLVFNQFGKAAPAYSERSPGTKLVLSGNMSGSSSDFALGVTAADLWYSVPVASLSYSHKFYGGTEELMIIRGDKRVGIGISSPSYNLDVTGNGRYTTDLLVGGALGIGGPTSFYDFRLVKSTSYFIASFENTGGTNASEGINILAGSNTGGGASFIEFTKPGDAGLPDVEIIGSIKQSGADGVSYNATSDRRIKENIVGTHFGVDDLMRIQVRDFEFIRDPENRSNTGFIAQELFEVYPNAVSKPVKDDDLWQVDYGKVTPLLVKAVQDQQHIIESLLDENQQLKAQNNDLEKRLERIEKMVLDEK